MKKLLVILAIVLLPLSAFAGMSAITDSEMDAVTGQMGVSIAIVDQQQDLSIASLTWGDADAGTRYVHGAAVTHTAGYINIQDIALVKNTTTLNGVVCGTLGIAAEPLKIDVVTVSAADPFIRPRGKTAVAISLSDSLQTIDEIRIGSISLDSAVATVTTYAGVAGSASYARGGSLFFAALNSGAQYVYSTDATALNSHQLGKIYIRGFAQIGYSALESFNVSTALPNVSNRPAAIYIWAHDGSGN